MINSRVASIINRETEKKMEKGPAFGSALRSEA
jgi:hypothetical protein